MEDSRPARYVSEFVGTYFLVMVTGCNVVAGNYVWGVLSTACIFLCFIYAFRGASTFGISPGYFNPAISIALGVSGKLPMVEAFIYCAIQLIGGIMGAFSFALLFWENIYFAPMPGVMWSEAALAETSYTMMLCFVTLNCSVLKGRGHQFYGLAIAMALVAGGYGAGARTGFCFNPAVALSIDLMSAGSGFGWGVAYTGFELIGAALASIFFRAVRPDEFGVQAKSMMTVPVPVLVAEFIGTFFLVLTIGINVLVKSPAGALSVAAALMSMIFSLGDISAHLNPAVTMAVVASGRRICAPKQGLFIMLVQCIAGVFAAFTYQLICDNRGVKLGVAEGYKWSSAFSIEVLFTAVLCMTVLSTCTVQKKRQPVEYSAFAIASVIVGGGYVVGSVAGGTLNPAANAGIALAGQFSSTVQSSGFPCVVYSLIEFVGAGLAAGLFKSMHKIEYEG